MPQHIDHTRIELQRRLHQVEAARGSEFFVTLIAWVAAAGVAGALYGLATGEDPTAGAVAGAAAVFPWAVLRAVHRSELLELERRQLCHQVGLAHRMHRLEVLTAPATPAEPVAEA